MFYSISNLCHRSPSSIRMTGVWDVFYRDLMMATAAGVMTRSGVNVVRSLVRRNEIALIVQHPKEDRIEPDMRSLNSLLVGEASATATVLAEMRVPFVCGSSFVLDNAGDTINYCRFLQRQNQKVVTQMLLSSLLQHIGGKTKKQAARILRGMDRTAQIHLLLSDFGVDVHLLPDWQQWGDILYWVEIEGKRHLYTGEGLTAAKPFVIFQHMGEEYRDAEYE
ncbi:MAG: hypothetical protein WC551_11620 [Patescibacteria group bacterium]